MSLKIASPKKNINPIKGEPMQTLRDVMTQNVQFIHPETTLDEAAEQMRNLNIGVLPICEGKTIQGMITDRDIVVRALADRRDPHHTPVSEFMTRDVVFSYDTQPVAEALSLMQSKQVRRLIVLDRNRSLVGVVSWSDLMGQSNRRTFRKIAHLETPRLPRFRFNARLTTLIGSSIVALGYFAFMRRSQFQDRLKKVIPLSPERKSA